MSSWSDYIYGAASISENIKKHNRLVYLDSARGIAALFVVVSHSAGAGFLPSIFGKGFGQTGVVLFFMISGYLMARLYLDSSFDQCTVKKYILRRTARVVPLYIFALFITALLLVTFNLNIYQTASIHKILQSASLLRGFNVFWTVPVEIHFYIVFLVVWFFVSKFNIYKIFIYLILVQIFMYLVLSRFTDSIVWLFYWLHIFLLGISISKFQTVDFSLRKSNFLRRIPNALVPLILFTGAILLPPEVRNGLGIPTFPRYKDPFVILYLIFFLWHVVTGSRYLKFLNNRIFQYFGLISYSVYIVHVPMIQLTKYFLETSGLSIHFGFAFLIFSTISTSSLTYILIEKPMNNWAGKLN